MYNDLSYKYPADIQKAKDHRMANRIFKGLSRNSYKDQKCQCCGRRIGVVDFVMPVCYNPTEELIFLGPGVPLLFTFVQNAMLFLTFFTLFFSIYSIITNLLGNSCQQNEKCIDDIFNQLSVSNKISDKFSLLVQTFLISGFILFFNFLQQHLILRIRRVDISCDEFINSPSDYSIMIRNLPANISRNDIEVMIQSEKVFMDRDQIKLNDDLSIHDIIISYKLTEYLKEVEDQNKQFIQQMKTNPNAPLAYKQIEKPTQTSSFAIVIFNRQASKESFIQSLKCMINCKNFFCNLCLPLGQRQVKGQKIIIQRAPEPDDIIWRNSDIPRKRVIKNKILAHICGILILFCGGVVQYFLQYHQQFIKDKTLDFIYSVVSSVAINIFNFIIVQFLVFVTTLQGNLTQTSLNESLLMKICLYEFFNAGIFYSVANVLAQTLNNFNLQGSFSFEIMLFMLINALSPNILNLILVKLEIPNIFLRLLYERGWFEKTQSQANKLYQLTHIKFPEKYAYVIKTVWLTCFYAPFTPIVVPISILGLVLFYFTQAYLFRTSYNVPPMLAISICKSATYLLSYSPAILSGGQILIIFYIKYSFGSTLTVNEQVSIFLCVFLSIITFLIPSYKINKRLFKLDRKNNEQLSYQDASLEFQTFYEQTNPLNTSNNSQRSNRMQRNLFKFMNINIADKFIELENLTPNQKNGQPLLKNYQSYE